MLRATKVRIYPTSQQAEFLNTQFGAVRFVYNKALYIKKQVYQRHGVSLSPHKDLKPLLAVAKKSRRYGWLKEYDSIALQQAVINLDVAFSNFFNPKLKTRFPAFKRKHGRQSSYHCVGIKVFDGAIKIPKISPIEARLHREITGTLKSITLSRSATGKYYAALLCDDGIEVQEKPSLITHITGLDMGLSHYAIKSDGGKVNNPRHLINASRNLRRKHKALSRRKKGSANRRKARIQLAGVHERIANARADFQHKLSRAIVDENQAVIVETLKSTNMMKNHNLARAIGDAGWAGFITKLEYKAAEKGVHLVKLDQWFASSKTCHCCGYKMPEMPLYKRIWQCPECDVEHDRDINAAINIERKGILELCAAGLVVQSAHGGQRKSVTQTVAA
ncbi:IS200/IS605 family element transposase accessory protein TnpB [Klebsiella sp. RHBSTW-00215]|uniref:RNA-guided endonuclease InsQ/TnpB family protein n=1 Tax=Klebsiella sp. RHBSTW-00215 TaxID=2742640 RepID=UPI0015F593BD|nr:RNA-guided endonuclease TnpB family protein [Klebsiella sp. RHBSTW-00215]MBA7933542.1 IS200/IS605 family element transposase accessory protein TnpB [Klebsiella sp. RHBSTW-00215]